jgi:hypothetical protein
MREVRVTTEMFFQSLRVYGVRPISFRLAGCSD